MRTLRSKRTLRLLGFRPTFYLCVLLIPCVLERLSHAI
jgi:hypothetical protein